MLVYVNNQTVMRTFLLSLALLVSAVAAAQVPSVTVENAKGESFDTSLLLEEGTPMIVSFWSTSCKPCIRELDAIYDALPDWLDEVKFRVVAVSTDDSRLLAKAKSFAEGRGWGEDYVLLFDKNQDFMRAMNVSVVPHVFVLDAKGKIVYSHTSYVPGNELELFEAIKKSQK
jgi:peroxiredoxin